MTVYRVPLRRVFAKKKGRVKGDTQWDSIYGRAKCVECKLPIKEGDVYTVVTLWKGATKTVPVHKYMHVECPVVKVLKTRKPRGKQVIPAKRGKKGLNP